MTNNLKKLIQNGNDLSFVGAHNAFVAKLVEKAGFEGVYLSGAGLSNSMGVPDTGILTREDFVYMGGRIAKATALPVLADADTGFGDVAETVESYIKAGIAGLHIEDQLFPKRCGHLDGKEVVPADEAKDMIRLAVKTRDKLDPNFVIIARTDARGAANVKDTEQFGESVRRGKIYKDAGADIIFPESLKTREELEKYRGEVNGVLLANMTEFGKTPFTTADEFYKLGFQIVIFPVTIFRYLAGRTAHALEILKKDGFQKNLIAEMMTREEINKVLSYDPKK